MVYEDNRQRQTDLGIGFSPVLTADGKVALIRGRRFGYGQPFDCGDPKKKNWIVVYDPATKEEKMIFDRAVNYGEPGVSYCVFDEMQLSHDGSILYLVSQAYATSGTLAIVNLPNGSERYVPGVDSVYVIETGPHRDELIYVQRVMRSNPKHRLEFPTHPLIHARANGEQIEEISTESFTLGGKAEMPILSAYLRRIGGTITVNGRKFP